MEHWERCAICGLEWPAGMFAECPAYRNADHRQRRTGNRAEDVVAFTIEDDAAPDAARAWAAARVTAVVPEPVVDEREQPDADAAEGDADDADADGR